MIKTKYIIKIYPEFAKYSLAFVKNLFPNDIYYFNTIFIITIYYISFQIMSNIHVNLRNLFFVLKIKTSNISQVFDLI